MNNNVINICAKEMVNLTYKLEKVCASKENMFCKDLEITPSEFRFLRHIKEHGKINAKNIASIMEATAPRISKLLKNLQEKKYILIKKDKKDKRYSLVCLSKKGSTFINSIMEKYIDFHQDMLLSLKENDEELLKIMTTLKDFGNMMESFCSVSDPIKPCKEK